MDFKDNQQAKIISFAEITAEEFERVDVKIDYVIRVLGSRELTAQKPNKVRSLAIAINEVLGSSYRPLVIRKNRATRELKGLSKEGRKKELEGVYELNDCPDLKDKAVLIVDDIYTFGTSMETIGEVLRTAYPSVKLYGFALAHNWQRGTDGVNGNNDHFEQHYRTILAKHEKKHKE